MKIMKINNQTNQQTKPNFQAKILNPDDVVHVMSFFSEKSKKGFTEALLAQKDPIRAINIRGIEPNVEFVGPDGYNFLVSLSHRDNPSLKNLGIVGHLGKESKEIASDLVEVIKNLSAQMENTLARKNWFDEHFSWLGNLEREKVLKAVDKFNS